MVKKKKPRIWHSESEPDFPHFPQQINPGPYSLSGFLHDGFLPEPSAWVYSHKVTGQREVASNPDRSPQFKLNGFLKCY